MKVLPLYDSKILFRQLSEGDEKAFRKIFDLYKERLYFVALKMLKSPAVAEEIVQDTLMAVWTNQSKFTTIDDPEAYVFTIAYNRIYNQLKKTANEHKLVSELIYILQNDQYSGDDIILASETKAIIDEAIEKLPPQRKLIFQLSRQQGLTHEQIANKLNLSRNTVRNQITEALQQIRTHLGKTAIAVVTLLWNNFPK